MASSDAEVASFHHSKSWDSKTNDHCDRLARDPWDHQNGKNFVDHHGDLAPSLATSLYWTQRHLCTAWSDEIGDNSLDCIVGQKLAKTANHHDDPSVSHGETPRPQQLQLHERVNRGDDCGNHLREDMGSDYPGELEDDSSPGSSHIHLLCSPQNDDSDVDGEVVVLHSYNFHVGQKSTWDCWEVVCADNSSLRHRVNPTRNHD